MGQKKVKRLPYRRPEAYKSFAVLLGHLVDLAILAKLDKARIVQELKFKIVSLCYRGLYEIK